MRYELLTFKTVVQTLSHDCHCFGHREADLEDCHLIDQVCYSLTYTLDLFSSELGFELMTFEVVGRSQTS